MRTTNWVIDVLECILRCILPSCILIELVYVVYKLFAFPKTVLLVHSVIKGRILFGLVLMYLYYLARSGDITQSLTLLSK